MIAIINKGHPDKEEMDSPHGNRIYGVQINNKFICEFEHRRINGLSECLRLASEAVKKDYEGRGRMTQHEELNKQIHKLRDECWHEFEEQEHTGRVCINCHWSYSGLHSRGLAPQKNYLEWNNLMPLFMELPDGHEIEQTKNPIIAIAKAYIAFMKENNETT